MNIIEIVKNYIDETVKKLYLSQSFEWLYNRGIDFYNKKKYEKAIKFFMLALEKPKFQPQVYYNLALSYQHLKDYEKAIVIYDKFLALKPDDYDGLYNLALTYYTFENFAKAIELFEKCLAIKKDEDGVKAFVLACLNKNEEQKVLDFAEEIWKLSTDSENLYYAIAKVFENKHSLSKDFKYIEIAIDMYLKILERNPQHFSSYLSISICYAKKGEWQNSVDFCTKALDANPKSYEANNQMGLVYYCCNQIEDSIKYYEIALKLKPEGDYKIYSNLAYAYEKMGEKKKAVKLFNQLISKFPNYPAKNEIKNHLRILKEFDRY